MINVAILDDEAVYLDKEKEITWGIPRIPSIYIDIF